jgi:hypothetical protein
MPVKPRFGDNPRPGTFVFRSVAALLNLRTWAPTPRDLATATNDAKMAAEMRRLAEQLEGLAALKERAGKDRAPVD